MDVLTVRALDVLEDFLNAVRRAGPDHGDLDIDYEALSHAVGDARVVLYEAGRFTP